MEDKKMTEEFLDEKVSKKKLEKKDKEEKSMFQRVMNVILWIVLFAWMAVCLIDFYKVHQKQDPIFCFKKDVTHYNDGDVKWCLGPGYKVFQYNRKSFQAIEFGPFWSKDRSAEEENK
jgi:hypothetical protein